MFGIFKPKFGQYIVWPDSLEIVEQPEFDGKKLSATQISTHFKLTSQKINQILDELGWREIYVFGKCLKPIHNK
ncbi:hypothetical protein [Photobacterium leiognathi]|uniref:hypothetical protein n=1 Tax=Photobacterium leiognathi TaxID=553611 RepID=UPI002732854F|nr:hypothetical protein [Photobacterium leiognathi]